MTLPDPSNTPRARSNLMPLIVVGLTIAGALAVWIIMLGSSVSANDAKLTNPQTLADSLNDFEALMERLESDLAPTAPGAHPTGDVEARVLNEVDELDLAVQTLLAIGRGIPNDPIQQRLTELQSSTALMVSAARDQATLRGVPADEEEFADFEQIVAPVERDLRATNSSVNRYLFELASSLVGKLLQLLTVGGLSVLLSVCFAIALMWRMRTSAIRHEKSMRALHESRERFRLLAENIPGVIYLCLNDERYTITFISDGVEQLTGYPRDDFLSNRKSFVELFHPEDAPMIAPRVDEAVAAHERFELDYRIRHKDGSWRWIHEVGVGVYRNGELECLEGFLTDITERVLADQELHRQKEYLRQVIDLDPNLIFAKNRQGMITLANRALAQLYGTTVELLEGRTDTDVSPNKKDVEHFRRDDLEVMDTGREKFIAEETVTDSEGRVRWFQTYKRAIRDRTGTADQVLGVATEITALKRAELIKSGRSRVLELMTTGAPLNEVLDAVVYAFQDALPGYKGAVALIDAETNGLALAAAPDLSPDVRRQLASCDPVKVMTCGKPNADGMGTVVSDLELIDDDTPVRRSLVDAGFRSCWTQSVRSEAGDILGAFMLFGTSPGKPRASDLETMSSAAQIAAIAVQRKHAEQELEESQTQLRAADRLASIGTLTAGLGHDMNNILFPLRCRLEALNWEELPPQVAEVLRATRETINYIQQLSDGLRLLAADPDRSDEVGASTDISRWWSQVSSLIRDALPRNIELTSHIADDLPSVPVASHRLTQAVLNLAINAAEATEDDSPVDVWARRSADGRQVEIGVTDHGSGMADEVKSRALDPFFTTKTRALSTGLGLSLVHGVVKACGGSIDIESTPGGGTTVVLRIPAELPGASASKRSRIAVVSLGDSRTAGWVSSVLSFEGYNVVQASNGEIPDSDLWVTDLSDRNLEIARRYLGRMPRPQVIVLGDAPADWSQLGALVVRSTGDLAKIKSAVQDSLHRADATNDVK